MTKKSSKGQGVLGKYANRAFIKELFFNPKYLDVTCVFVILLEILLNFIIINRVKYTEIDWKAYMQEVEGFLNGTFDYTILKGDTGPLVYPAGFVYVYSLLYYLTEAGTNIRLAQYIFLIIYILQLIAVYNVYRKTSKIAPYAIIISCLTSYRIHSLYVLRLFNDTVAVLLFYVSLNLFLLSRWKWGSFVYSLAVSVKMNVLLYAPCLLLTYLTNLTLGETALNLTICALVQIVLAAPFLYANPIGYIMRSFDLGRVFLHKWTVNYRFLDEDVFTSPNFHTALLVIHISLLLIFYPHFKRYLLAYAKINCVTNDLKHKTQFDFNSKAQLIVLPFFVTNFIGVVCARSLHYQFYTWYFHALLYLGFSTLFPKPVVFTLLGILELCWNTYPSTAVSSGMLHICHVALLGGIFNYMRR